MTNDKLNRFLRILNLPLEEGTELYFGADQDNNNWYRYMLGLEILTPETFEQLQKGKGRVLPTRALRSYLLEAERNFGLKDGNNEETIIDLGCGHGLLSFWIAQYRSKKVIAIGYPSQISFLAKILTLTLQKELINPTSKVVLVAQPLSMSTVILSEQLDPESSDKIILNDVMEHFHPSLYYNLCLSSYNTLKKHGVLISKCHNTDNILVLQRLRKYWSNCEVDYLVAQRESYLGHSAPALTSSEIKELAIVTRGYTKATADGAIQYYNKCRKMLPLNDHMVPIDLDLDNYMLENYVSPILLKKYFEFFGFKTTIEPGLEHSRRLKFFSPLRRLLPGLLLRIPYFSQVLILKAIKV